MVPSLSSKHALVSALLCVVIAVFSCFHVTPLTFLRSGGRQAGPGIPEKVLGIHMGVDSPGPSKRLCLSTSLS